MQLNSKEKGKRGELEFSHLCKEFGFDVRRSQQYAGIHGDADIVGLEGIHVEVKRVEKLNISRAMEQSARDCGQDTPIVAHRKNREPWYVTMTAKDWFMLYKAWRNGVGTP